METKGDVIVRSSGATNVFTHWLDLLENPEKEDVNIICFNYADINATKPDKYNYHIKGVIRNHFGERTKKVNDPNFIAKAIERHDANIVICS